MRSTAARRAQALILTAVLLVGGSGVSALDLALYHLGGHVEAAGHRVAGTDAPRPHGDACALVDWAARGPYAVALPPLPAVPAGAGERAAPALVPDVPRPHDLSAAPKPRAPPVHLA